MGFVETEVLVMMDNDGQLKTNDRGLTLRELVRRDVRKLMDGAHTHYHMCGRKKI